MLRSARILLLFLTLLVSYGATWATGKFVRGERAAARLRRTHGKNAERLTRACGQLGGVFIKLGQVLSVVGTFLPKEYAEHLETLQDRVTPRPFREIEQRLIGALGPNALERFAEFERVPLAAASLAQVHAATTLDGQRVAVKVLYPGIAQLIENDLRVIAWLLPIARRLVPVTRIERVLDQLGAMLKRETDYANEHANIERMRSMFSDMPEVVVPRVCDTLTSGGVLTLSFETGIKINDVAALTAAGIDSKAVGALLVAAYFRMLFEQRLFHADPHPGNFLVRPGPVLVILDYGAVEQVTAPLKEGMKMVLLGVLSKNDDSVLRGLERMGFVAEGGDRELLKRVGRDYLKALSGLSLTNFADLDRAALTKLSGYQQLRGQIREVMRSVEYPEGYFYIERTLALLFGLVGQLAPEQGLVGLVLPYASRVFSDKAQRKAAP